MLVKDLQTKTVKQLNTLIEEYKAELFMLRFKNATGQLEQPHKISLIKKDIARVYTALNLKASGTEVKTTPAKPVAKKPVAKPAPKKAPAKPAAKKTAAKPAPKKAPAKPAAKKPAAKKPVAKKAPVKKAVAKKPAVKKAATKGGK